MSGGWLLLVIFSHIVVGVAAWACTRYWEELAAGYRRRRFRRRVGCGRMTEEEYLAFIRRMVLPEGTPA